MWHWRTMGIVCAATVLAACSSSTSPSQVRDVNVDVAFVGCDVVKCADTINGAPYEIVMPTKWNGTLLIYSHGYRGAQPEPPSFEPVETTPEPAPGWGSGIKGLGQALLDQGYAIAGSAYASNGWAVADGVRAGEDLHSFFVSSIGTPSRVYVWGDSLGGLITEQLAEKNPEWVAGAAPLCGVLAGVLPNYDLALDVSFAVKTLIDPDLKLSGYTSYEDAVRTLTAASKKVIAAASDTKGGGTAKVIYIASLVDAPHQTQRFDGATLTSKVSGYTEAIITALGFGTLGRYDVERRYNGNISSNEGVDYAARISNSDAELVDAVSPHASKGFTARLQAGVRVVADPSARAAALAEGGDPQGQVHAPTITLHTAADPLVIVQNESFFRARYRAQQAKGNVQSDLVQLFTVAPATYPGTPGAPFGAGHCNFTPESRLAVISLLDRWVREGIVPTGAILTHALPPAQTGYEPLYEPGSWPEPAAMGVRS